MASQPGCLPDSFSAFSMEEEPEIIHEEILSQMDDGEEEELDWEAVKSRVANLSLEGDAIDSPDGRVIEVIRKSCADVLRDNGIAV